VAIDELHVVSQWAEWRESYGHIQLLRSRIHTDVPWFGTTATLPVTSFKKVLKDAGFSEATHRIHISVDRKEIYIELYTLRSPSGSFRDLFFLVPQNTSCFYIPKTVIYMETTDMILKALEMLRDQLVQQGYGSQAVHIVQPYYALMADYDKLIISQEFVKPDSMHRIIIATDAMGMGINNPDIRTVVQRLCPPDCESLVQRMGRSARAKGQWGHFIWMIPPMPNKSRSSLTTSQRPTRNLGFRSSQLSQAQCLESSNPDISEQSSDLQSDETSCGRLPAILFQMAQSNACFRSLLLSEYQTDGIRPQLQRCCSYCHPDYNIVKPSVTWQKVNNIYSPLNSPTTSLTQNQITFGMERLVKWSDSKF
jgi:superfamily II DNA helicase RecQ